MTDQLYLLQAVMVLLFIGLAGLRYRTGKTRYAVALVVWCIVTIALSVAIVRRPGAEQKQERAQREMLRRQLIATHMGKVGSLLQRRYGHGNVLMVNDLFEQDEQSSLYLQALKGAVGPNLQVVGVDSLMVIPSGGRPIDTVGAFRLCLRRHPTATIVVDLTGLLIQQNMEAFDLCGPREEANVAIISALPVPYNMALPGLDAGVVDACFLSASSNSRTGNAPGPSRVIILQKEEYKHCQGRLAWSEHVSILSRSALEPPTESLEAPISMPPRRPGVGSLDRR